MSDLCFDDIDQNCDECYELTQEDCLPEVIQAGLTPAASFWLWCIAPDGNYYKDEITIAGDGSFTIDVDSGAYPTGLFNKYAGKFEFFLSTSQTDPTPTAFTISAVSYNCLIMEWTVNCCDNTYTPPTDCDKLLDTLSPSELNTCILPTYDFSDAVNVQPNVTAQQQSDLSDWLCGCPDPPVITYYRSIPLLRRANSIDYDLGWYLVNDDFWTPQSNIQGLMPVVDSQDETKLDSTIAGNTNAFGNYERFTNDLGGTVTDGSDGSTPLYLIDHLTGKGYRTVETLKNASHNWHTVALNAYNYSIANVPDGGNYTGWRMIEYNDINETFAGNGNTSLVFTGTSSIWIMNTINVNSGLFMRRDRAVWASTLRIDDASLTATNLGTLLVRNHY